MLKVGGIRKSAGGGEARRRPVTRVKLKPQAARFRAQARSRIRLRAASSKLRVEINPSPIRGDSKSWGFLKNSKKKEKRKKYKFPIFYSKTFKWGGFINKNC